MLSSSKDARLGISTYIGGRLYWKVTHNFGKRTFVLTHLDAASDNLFGMTKHFHEHCPAVLRPQTKASNAKEMSFGKLDSGYKVATAGSAEIRALGNDAVFPWVRGRVLAQRAEARCRYPPGHCQRARH